MEKFGRMTLATILFALLLFVQSIVQMFMWNWFITPLGVVKIGFWLSMGISLTISMFCGKNGKFEGEKIYEQFITQIFVFLMIWGIGAIIQLFV